MKYKIYNNREKIREKVVVLIHGAYHGMWCWEINFVPFFLERNYTVISIDYIENFKKLEETIKCLNDILGKIAGKLYMVSHSLGAAIVERYITRYSPELAGVIFIAPGPVIKRIRRTLIINIHNLLSDRANFYFSNRVKNKETEKYISMLRKQTREMELLIVRRNISRYFNWKYRTLVLGTRNDQCMPLSVILDAGKFFKAKVIIYEELCHDMMLDPMWKTVAVDIDEFIQMNYD